MIRIQLSNILRLNMPNDNNIIRQLSQRTVYNGAFTVRQQEQRKVFQVSPLKGMRSTMGLKNVSSILQGHNSVPGISHPARNFHLLKQFDSHTMNTLFHPKPNIGQEPLKRTLVIFGFKGRRKTVKAVVHRFYRLQWGAWIRPRSGRHRKLYRKRDNLRRWARYHVFCNATQTTMLDKMVTKFWRRKKYYVDDPYETYHTRPDFPITARRGLK